MRLLVAPNDLVLGGSSLNAVDLAAEMQHRGHHVLIAAPRGELEARLRRLDLHHAVVPYAPGNRLDTAAVGAMRDVARRFRPDVVHTWEFGACYSAFFGWDLPRGGRHLATVMSMEVPRSLPRTVPLTLGTKALAELARTSRRGPVWLLEPPVDVAAHRSVTDVDVASFHALVGSPQEVPTVVMVSRLTRAMKLEGVLDTIRAVGELARQRSVQLIIVGGGDAFDIVKDAAAALNDTLGQRAVFAPGPVDDPRPAYRAADVIVGMGSSAIRGLAAERPVIVVGVDGFLAEVTADSFPYFDENGFWGVGGVVDRPRRLVAMLDSWLDDAPRRQAVGAWGRQVALGRYTVEAVTDRLEGIYETVSAHPVGRTATAVDAAATIGRTVDPRWRRPLHAIRRQRRRLRKGR